MASLIALAIIGYTTYYLWQTSAASLAATSSVEKQQHFVTREMTERENPINPDPTLIISDVTRFPVIESHIGQWGIQHNVHHDTGGYAFDTWGPEPLTPMNSL